MTDKECVDILKEFAQCLKCAIVGKDNDCESCEKGFFTNGELLLAVNHAIKKMKGGAK